MIIHIDGPSGVGKTTLGKKISSQLKTDVIEIDDIVHHNVNKLISKLYFDINQKIFIDKYQSYTDFKDELLSNFEDELLKLNQVDLDKILENYKDKNLLLTGGLHNMVIHIDKGYRIKIDDEIYYKQYNIRLLERIYKNYDEIKEILNSDISLYYKPILLGRKYFVVPGFLLNYDDWVNINENIIKENLYKSWYKYATQYEIFNEIEQLLKKK
jgi:adenylate kinase family enzyme